MILQVLPRAALAEDRVSAGIEYNARGLVQADYAMGLIFAGLVY